MTTKTKQTASKKTQKKKAGSAMAKKQGELVGGRFRPESDLAKMYTLLSDGKARTIDEIQNVVEAKVKANIGNGKYSSLSTWGKESGTFTMTKADGKIQMVMTDNKKQPRKETKKSSHKSADAEGVQVE
jgi:hypothetical protein